MRRERRCLLCGFAGICGLTIHTEGGICFDCMRNNERDKMSASNIKLHSKALQTLSKQVSKDLSMLKRNLKMTDTNIPDKIFNPEICYVNWTGDYVSEDDNNEGSTKYIRADLVPTQAVDVDEKRVMDLMEIADCIELSAFRIPAPSSETPILIELAYRIRKIAFYKKISSEVLAKECFSLQHRISELETFIESHGLEVPK